MHHPEDEQSHHAENDQRHPDLGGVDRRRLLERGKHAVKGKEVVGDQHAGRPRWWRLKPIDGRTRGEPDAYDDDRAAGRVDPGRGCRERVLLEHAREHQATTADTDQ